MFVIAGLSQTDFFTTVSDFAVSSAIGFLMALIGSILLKFSSNNLYFHSLFLSGFIVGFFFLLIILYQFANDMYLSSIAFQLVGLIATIIFGTVFSIVSYNFSKSLRKARKEANIKIKEKFFSTISMLMIIIGLTINVISNVINLIYYYFNKVDCQQCLDFCSHGFLVFAIGLIIFGIIVNIKIGNRKENAT